MTDRKLEYLTKGGELAGLALDGVLEEWEYFYLVEAGCGHGFGGAGRRTVL